MPLVRLDNVHKSFHRAGGPVVHAVNGVSFEISPGETVALIGESGSGKSTIARAIAGLGPVESGSIRLDGAELTSARDRALEAGRRGVQIVFQDPTSALNPRWPVWRSIVEPRLLERLGRVRGARGLPHTFSGRSRRSTLNPTSPWRAAGLAATPAVASRSSKAACGKSQ